MREFDERFRALSPEQRRLLELKLKKKGLKMPGAAAAAGAVSAASAGSSQASAAAGPEPLGVPPAKAMQFSLYFFSGDGSSTASGKYQLLLDSARRADAHDFVAVWMPERHFHPFGGLYPNPSLLISAVAMITERVQLRAGSVVLPLHNDVRLAEEWSVIDNLSNGRVAMAAASGWHPNDFALAPGIWEDRRGAMDRSLETLRTLWRGDMVKRPDGVGKEIEIRIYPKPIQPELPIWMTTGGSLETFVKAGESGANLLTAVLGQTIDEVAEKVAAYRDARARNGHDPATGIITLMMHCFLGDDVEAVRETVRAPFCDYLKTYLGLEKNLAKSLNLELGLDSLSQEDLDALLEYAYGRYFNTSALFGTPESTLGFVEKVAHAGVDEIACLIDFGVDPAAVLGSLDQLKVLQDRVRARVSTDR